MSHPVVHSFHINVGAGDAAIHIRASATSLTDVSCEYDFERAVLIDGGDGNHQGLKNIERLLQELPSRYKNIKKLKWKWLKLDAIVFTHWDTDHWTGICKLLKEQQDKDGKLPFLKYDKGLPRTNVYAPDDRFPKDSVVLDKTTKPHSLSIGNAKNFANFYHGESLIGANFFEHPDPSKGPISADGPLSLYNTVMPKGSNKPAMFCVGCNRKIIESEPTPKVIDTPITVTNQKSIANIIVWPSGQITHYFAGDLDFVGEIGICNWIVKKSGPIEIANIKLSHHGAKSSTPLVMFPRYQPRNVIISAGGKHGHPSPESIMYLISYFDSLPKAKTPASGVLWLTQYPYWMRLNDKGECKPFHRFSVQAFLLLPPDQNGKAAKLAPFQRQVIANFAARSRKSNLWKDFQEWAKLNIERDSILNRDAAFTKLSASLARRYNHHSIIGVKTAPGISQNITGSTSVTEDYVWYIGAFQADPKSGSSGIVFHQKQGPNSVDFPLQPTAIAESKKRKYDGPDGGNYYQRDDEQILKQVKTSAMLTRSQAKREANQLLSAGAQADDDDDDDEDIVFSKPAPKPRQILRSITCCLCFSGFDPKQYTAHIPQHCTVLQSGHPLDSFTSTLSNGLIAFDVSKTLGPPGTFVFVLHANDFWSSWMRLWLKDVVITAMFNNDPVKYAGSDKAIPNSFTLTLLNGVTFSTLELSSSLGLDRATASSLPTFGAFPNMGTVGFGLAVKSVGWADTGAKIFATLQDYLGWNATAITTSKSFLASLVSNSSWQLNTKSKAGERGSAVWFTPSLGNMLTVRLEFKLSGEDAKFSEQFKSLIPGLGSRVSLADLGMTFKWYNSMSTNHDAGETTGHGVARIWLHSKLTLCDNHGEFNIDFDILREGDLHSVTIYANPKALTIDKAIAGFKGLADIPDFTTLAKTVPSSFFGNLCFRRLKLVYDNMSDSFKVRDTTLEFEAIFHAKGHDNAPVSINVCIGYTPHSLKSFLRFRASLWTPNLPPLNPRLSYQILPAYETFEDFGPQPGAAPWLSVLSIIPGLTIPQPPAGILTDITDLGFAFENNVISVWGTLENCTFPPTGLPTISLGQVSLTCTYSLEPNHNLTFALQLAIEIAPPNKLVNADAVIGASLLCGNIAYKTSTGWAIEATALNLSLAHIWRFFDSTQSSALVKVLGSIVIQNLAINYALEKPNSARMIAQSATSLSISSEIELRHGNDDTKPTILNFKYDYRSRGDWDMSAYLQRAASTDINLRTFLAMISPADGLLDDIFDLVGDILLVKAGSTVRLGFDVKPESRQNSSTKNINLRASLQLDKFDFTYCQYSSVDKASKDTVHRFLLISIHGFDIMPTNIPGLKTLVKPFDSLYILWTDDDLKKNDLNSLEPSFANSYSANSVKPGDQAFEAGFHIGIQSDGKVILNHHFGKQTTRKSTDQDLVVNLLHPDVFPTDRAIDKTTNISTTKWEKQIGPLTISDLGLKFQDGKIIVILTTSLRVGPVQMQAFGFELGLDLKNVSDGNFQFNADISGLGLAISSAPLVLAGSLIKKKELYLGGIIASFQPYMLQAVGAYGTVNDMKTAFIILCLGGPLLNINGIMISDVTAGFGYNSDIKFPDPNSVSSFPMILIGQPPAPLDPLRIFRSILDTGWITPKDASIWAGAGVRASAFNMVDAKVATVFKIESGHLTQIGIFALCTAQMPKKPANKLFVSIELGMTTVLDLVHGSMLVSASLSPTSYVLAPACRLTGGFAAGTWFGSSPYAGDWVFVLGGYHPKYTPPVYYPKDITRIGISWQIDQAVSVKANAYFAITPKVCMGGASMQAMCNVAGLHASFLALIDFLMNFNPFHYILDVSIDISVSWRCRVLFIWVSMAVDITANLHMCGPPTYGIFSIKIPIKNVNVEFGDATGKAPSKAVSLDTFRTMLKQPGKETDGKEVKISCESGLLSKKDTSGVWMVRAGTFSFQVRSNVAITQLVFNRLAFEGVNKVSAKPMQANGCNLKTDLKVTISGSADLYRLSSISGGLPSAIWSQYNANQDPGSSTSDKTALFDGSSSTVVSVYGLSVRAPKSIPSNDQIKPFKVRYLISSTAPRQIPAAPPSNPAWDGHEAKGNTISDKRRNIKSAWKSPSKDLNEFANIWINAMGWIDFKPATERPNRLLDHDTSGDGQAAPYGPFSRPSATSGETTSSYTSGGSGKTPNPCLFFGMMRM